MTMNPYRMESRERIEFYLELARRLLESSRSESRRFFLKVERFLTVICVFEWEEGVVWKK